MTIVRIALANVQVPSTPEDSVALATRNILAAGASGSSVVCFPECFIPGYRWPDSKLPPADPTFLQRAWKEVAAAAKQARITVILGTERITEQGLQICACVFNPDGSIAGWQDKCQLDPSEESIYPSFGSERRMFAAGELKFAVVICHEGWRYPETVRWAAQRGAHVVFHPHAHRAEPNAAQPQTFADPTNSFHEKAVLCRAAENTCYFASVNCAAPNSGTTSAIAAPDGTLMCYQPYGQPGLLIADLDLSTASGLLATRCRTPPAELQPVHPGGGAAGVALESVARSSISRREQR